MLFKMYFFYLKNKVTYSGKLEGREIKASLGFNFNDFNAGVRIKHKQSEGVKECGALLMNGTEMRNQYLLLDLLKGDFTLGCKIPYKKPKSYNGFMIKFSPFTDGADSGFNG